jgi:serine/threonine-protein kinase
VLREDPSPSSDTGESERALLQVRVALFWKVLFFLTLFGNVLGLFGALVEPGIDLLITLFECAIAGVVWAVFRRGKRPIGLSRAVEACGMVVISTFGAFLSRYMLAGIVSGHSVVSPDGADMAEGYVSMIGLGANTLVVAIRAAVIPSLPRRTVIVTALAGVPLILVSTFVIPVTGGSLSFRAADSGIYAWLPLTMGIMWFFATITCAVISAVVYGLRAEAREARRFGQYVLERKLGEGGMGEVYRARHGMMRRPSAIKLLRSDRAGEANLKRFEREVQLTARLTHPNTITIFDYGRTADGIFYYAMELLDGANLERVVTVGGPQPPGRVVHILVMACGALAEAHSIGLIHRDIKPANIMLCTQGGEHDVVKVLDFGLVKDLEVDRQVKLTNANAFTGTPQYMAPESILDPDSVDARTDLYALGTVAYYLLAGADVFDGKTTVEVCSQHLHQAPEPLSARGVTVPAALEALVLACLSKDPKGRPESAAELRRLLEACEVEPWDNALAQSWWREHQLRVEGESVPPDETGRTIAVDGARRESPVTPGVTVKA